VDICISVQGTYPSGFGAHIHLYNSYIDVGTIVVLTGGDNMVWLLFCSTVHSLMICQSVQKHVAVYVYCNITMIVTNGVHFVCLHCNNGFRNW